MDLMLGGGADWKKCTFNIVPFTWLFDTRTRQHVPSACIKHPSVLHENKGTLEPFSDARARFSSFCNAYDRHTHETTPPPHGHVTGPRGVTGFHASA